MGTAPVAIERRSGLGVVILTLGLFLLGVPYPILWGMLAGAFRFVPSVGVWLIAP